MSRASCSTLTSGVAPLISWHVTIDASARYFGSFHSLHFMVALAPCSARSLHGRTRAMFSSLTGHPTFKLVTNTGWWLSPIDLGVGLVALEAGRTPLQQVVKRKTELRVDLEGANLHMAH